MCAGAARESQLDGNCIPALSPSRSFPSHYATHTLIQTLIRAYDEFP